jgi:hypothetical protein
MDRFLVYKLSGGLNHMLKQINNAIHLSEMSNRILILDTKGGAFDNDFNKYFIIPDKVYFTNYETIENSELYKKYQKSIEGNVQYYNLDGKSILLTPNEVLKSEDEIVFFTYLRVGLGKKDWKIKVKKEVIEEIKSISKIENEYIGFHFRNTDMKSDFSILFLKVFEHTKDIKTLYFSTDDAKALIELESVLPVDVKIIQFTKPFDASGKNIHYGNPNKDEVIMNALIDMYYLKNSKYFIGSPGSSFSERVKISRENKDNLFD